MAGGEPAQIAPGRKHATYPALRQAPQGIKQAKLQAGGVLVQIRSPDMPVKLRRADPAAEQRQPQAGIKLAVKEKALLPVRLCQRDNRLCQRLFPRIAANGECGISGANFCRITDDHKQASLFVIHGQLIIKEPQHGLVVVRDIRSQYMYQCCHARLRQSKNTPLQRAK